MKKITSTSPLVLQDGNGNDIQVDLIGHNFRGEDKNNDGRLTYSLIAAENEIERWTVVYFSTDTNGQIVDYLFTDAIVLGFNPFNDNIPHVTTRVNGVAGISNTNEVIDPGEREVFLDCTINLSTGSCSDISWNTDANNSAVGFPLDFLITSSSQSPVDVSLYEGGELISEATGNFFTEFELANQPDPDPDTDPNPDTDPQAVPEPTSLVSLMIVGGFLLRYSKKYVL